MKDKHTGTSDPSSQKCANRIFSTFTTSYYDTLKSLKQTAPMMCSSSILNVAANPFTKYNYYNNTSSTTTAAASNENNNGSIYDRIRLSSILTSSAEGTAASNTSEQLIKIPFDYSSLLDPLNIKQLLEDAMAEYFRTTSTSVFLGIALGAAVTSGVFVGVLSISGLLRVVGINNDAIPFLDRFPSLFGYFSGNSRRNKETTINDSSAASTTSSSSLPLSSSTHLSSKTTTTTNNCSEIGVQKKDDNTFPRIFIIQGNVKPNTTETTPSLEQCQDCFNSVSSSLSKVDMTWKNVRRITAHLVSNRCDGSTFRKALSNYSLNDFKPIVIVEGEVPVSENDRQVSVVDSDALRNTVAISILYVQQLEQESACVQVEVIASS